MSRWLRQTRVRLALAYSGIFSLVALVAAAALWLGLASAQYSAIDGSLASRARTLQGAIAAGDGQRLPLDTVEVSRAEALGIGVALFDTNGNPLDSTQPGTTTAELSAVARRAALSAATIVETRPADREPLRVHAARFQVPGAQDRILVVTRPVAETDRLISTTALVLLLGAVMLIVAASVLGYGLAQTALRPVREIAATARGFSEEDLHRRITLDLPPDELGELADTFNGMLDRLENAFDSLRRFTADAAHELRAPLTLIRTEAEVALQRPRSPEEYQASLGTVLSEAQRLGRMADQLLMLARAEAGALPPTVVEVAPADLVADAVRMWQPLAAQRRITVVTATVDHGSLQGDPDLLRRVLDNLIDNAQRHSPSGGQVTVAAELVKSYWNLTVTDSGPGVPEEAKALVFERFARRDQARARATGGAGLGLALCMAIAELHRGTISVGDAPGGGARFLVRLPVLRT